jgi:hypothetical protein
MECGPPLTQGETKSKLENDSLVIATRTFLDDSWVDVATVNSGDDALLASLVGSRSYMLGLISASNISWSTLSTIWRKKYGSTSRIPSKSFSADLRWSSATFSPPIGSRLRQLTILEEGGRLS